jgi:flavodoxin
MKTAVVYYSLSGNTDFAAAEIAKVLKADKLKVETEGSGFFNFLCYKVTKKLPKLSALEFNADDYDKIVLGAPVWAWDVAPAMKSFLKKYPLKNKEIALLLCHGGGAGEKTLKKFKTLLDDSNKIVAEKRMVNPMKFQPSRSLSYISGWAEDIWQTT